MDAVTLCKADDLATHLLVDAVSFKCHKMNVNHPACERWTRHKCRKILNEYLDTANENQAIAKFLRLAYVQHYAVSFNLDTQSLCQMLMNYLQVHHPSSGIRLAKDSRYSSVSWQGGRVVATRPWKAGETVNALKGVMAPISREFERQVIIEGRNDFSLVAATRRSPAALLLGPIAFVNHDCIPSCRLDVIDGRVVVQTIRPMDIGSEVSFFYGQDYFGKSNSECRCTSCKYTGCGAYRIQRRTTLPLDQISTDPVVTSPAVRYRLRSASKGDANPWQGRLRLKM